MASRGEHVLWMPGEADASFLRTPSPFWREMIVMCPDWAPVAGRIWLGEEAWGLPIGAPFTIEPGAVVWRTLLFGYNARSSVARLDWIRWMRGGSGAVYASAVDLHVQHPLACWLYDRIAARGRR